MEKKNAYLAADLRWDVLALKRNLKTSFHEGFVQKANATRRKGSLCQIISFVELYVLPFIYPFYFIFIHITFYYI